MRLWTVHPSYLDAAGLTGAWREALLAQKVLAGETRGYRNHPQLERFRAQAHPLDAIAAFLRGLAGEARRRGYRFDATKIRSAERAGPITETEGQLRCEWRHLCSKLKIRSPELYLRHRAVVRPQPHPAFRIVPGEVRGWERASRSRSMVRRRTRVGRGSRPA